MRGRPDRGRFRPCRHGNAGRCALNPADRAYLRRLKGAVARDHRRLAAISGARDRELTPPSHQEYAFAVDLPVEQLVRLLGLIDLPLVGEELVDVDAALDREAGAIGLDDVGEGP